jgi:hypothetical protein
MTTRYNRYVSRKRVYNQTTGIIGSCGQNPLPGCATIQEGVKGSQTRGNASFGQLCWEDEWVRLAGSENWYERATAGTNIMEKIVGLDTV